jgi:hypothetical protein
VLITFVSLLVRLAHTLGEKSAHTVRKKVELESAEPFLPKKMLRNLASTWNAYYLSTITMII